MRHLLFIIILLLITKVKAEDYLNYHHKIIIAQDFIMDKKLDSALLVYKSAFSSVNKSFPKDYLNAATVAFELKKITLTKNYISLSIVSGGMFRSCHKRFKKKIKDKQFWKKELISCKSQKSKRNKLFFEIQTLLNKDQKVRKGLRFNRIYKINLTDSIIRLELGKYLEKNKYPGFITIGAHNGIDMMTILLMHINIDNYIEIVTNALKNGEITPSQAYSIYHRQKNDPRQKLKSTDRNEEEILNLIIKKYNKDYLNNNSNYRFNGSLWF